MLSLSFGRMSAEVQDYVPSNQRSKACFVARIWLLIHLTTIALAIVMQSILPLLVIGLPRLYGAWHHVIVGVLQHAALADNVTDHRLNSRSIYMNPISRFIYLNMNYHVEHHMFPIVPYHQLPALHEKIKHDLPAANPSIWHALKETYPVLVKQKSDPDLFLIRELPETAQAYQTSDSIRPEVVDVR